MTQTKDRTPIYCEPLQVKIEEVGGNKVRLVKRFMKKVRREEVLKPYYDRLMHFTSKSQKRRQKKLKAKYEEKKRQEKSED